jgi:hypothetical protein
MTTGVGINGFGRTAIIAPWAAVPSLPGGPASPPPRRLPLRCDDLPFIATTYPTLPSRQMPYTRQNSAVTDGKSSLRMEVAETKSRER